MRLRVAQCGGAAVVHQGLRHRAGCVFIVVATAVGGGMAFAVHLGAEHREVVMRIAMALFGGQREIGHGQRQVRGNALAVRVHQAQVVLRRGIALVCGFVVPLGRQFSVGFYVNTLRQQEAQLKLRVAVALHGG